MSLHDMIQADALGVFANTDDFAELVTYNPRQGCSRTIAAVVIRDSITTFVDDVQTVLPVYEVHVANSVSDGVSSYEINLGGDSFTFAPRDHKDAERKTIMQILTQDEGMLVLQCR